MESVLRKNNGSIYVALNQLDVDVLDDMGIEPLMICDIKLDVGDKEVSLLMDNYLIDKITYTKDEDAIYIVNSKTIFDDGCNITINLNNLSKLYVSHCNLSKLIINNKTPTKILNIYKSSIISVNGLKKLVYNFNITYSTIQCLSSEFVDQLNLKYSKVSSLYFIHIVTLMQTVSPITDIIGYISTAPKSSNFINTFGVREQFICVGNEFKEVVEIINECIDIYIPYIL